MRERRCVIGRLLAGFLLVLLLASACTHPEAPFASSPAPRADSPVKAFLHEPISTSEPTTVSVSTDPASSASLQTTEDVPRKRTAPSRVQIGHPQASRGWAGRFPLHRARSAEEIESLLAEGVGVDTVDRSGDTPLAYFLFGPSDSTEDTDDKLDDLPTSVTLAIARCLLDHGADPNAIGRRGSLLRTSLLLGKHYRLLLANGAKPTDTGLWRGEYLHAALDGDCVQALKEYGADLLARDRCGRTALFYPSTASKVDVLLEAGCRLDDRSLSGQTPLHEAAKCDRDGASPEASEGFVRLIERGADANAKDLLGRTPLHLRLNRELLRRGADINAQDIYKQTPVHYYASTFGAFGDFRSGYGSKHMLGPTIKDLPQVRPDTNARDTNGRVPLHWLAWRGPGALPLIEDVLGLGAKVNARDKFGRTPLDYARMTRDTEVEALLLSKGGEPGTTTATTTAGVESLLDPFARARGIVRARTYDFYSRDDIDLDSWPLYAEILDLNNDGCFDLAISADGFSERDGRNWVVMMGMPSGGFRPLEFEARPGVVEVLGGWVLETESASRIGHTLIEAEAGRKEMGVTLYRCDGYRIRWLDKDDSDEPLPDP